MQDWLIEWNKIEQNRTKWTIQNTKIFVFNERQPEQNKSMFYTNDTEQNWPEQHNGHFILFFSWIAILRIPFFSFLPWHGIAIKRESLKRNYNYYVKFQFILCCESEISKLNWIFIFHENLKVK